VLNVRKTPELALLAGPQVRGIPAKITDRGGLHERTNQNVLITGGRTDVERRYKEIRGRR